MQWQERAAKLANRGERRPRLVLFRQEPCEGGNLGKSQAHLARLKSPNPRLALGWCNRSITSRRTLKASTALGQSIVLLFIFTLQKSDDPRESRVRNTRVLESCVLTPRSQGRHSAISPWGRNPTGREGQPISAGLRGELTIGQSLPCFPCQLPRVCACLLLVHAPSPSSKNAFLPR